MGAGSFQSVKKESDLAAPNGLKVVPLIETIYSR